MPDGLEKPIGFVSCTLSSSDHNYFQVDEEALSLIFSIKKFHKLLYEQHFTITTDLPLIFSLIKRMSSLAAARLHRWAICCRHIITMYNIVPPARIVMLTCYHVYP